MSRRRAGRGSEVLGINVPTVPLLGVLGHRHRARGSAPASKGQGQTELATSGLLSLKDLGELPLWDRFGSSQRC